VRLFAAVALPEPVERAAGEWLASLEAGFGRGVRWVRPEGLHLTLHFFGAVPAEARPQIEAALAAGVAAGGGPFELALEGLGAFPSPARARVVWVGAAGPGVERLVRLQRAVAEAVAAAGFPLEQRPFHAHLTLGRVEGAPPPGLAAAIAAGAGRPLGRWVVDAVTLLRSERAPGGSRYTPLAAWRLEHALGTPPA
jgi:2'-5' RNA ligase